MKKILIKFILIVSVVLANFFIYRSSLIIAYNSYRGKNLVGEIKMGRRWTNFEKLKTEAIEFSGWSEQNRIDLSLDPKTKGVAIYEFEKPQNAKVTILQLGLSLPKSGGNLISLSTDQINWQTLKENQSLYRIPLEITSLIENRSRFWVKIEANNSKESGVTETILYDFHLMFYGHKFIFPNIIIIFASTVIPILFILRPKIKKTIKVSLLLLVFAWGIYLAWNNLIAFSYHSFDSDVYCLMKEVPRFYSLSFPSNILSNYCGNKESGTLLILIGFWKLFGEGSEIGIRLSSLLFHLLTIIFVFIYGKKINSFITGFVASLFIATNPYLVELSGRGLRDSAFTFLTLTFVFLLFAVDLKKVVNKIWLAVIGMLAIYLRLHSLIQYLILAPVSLINGKNNLKNIIFCYLILIAVALPLINYNLKKYGVWNYSESMHLKWNTNVEFSGQPGFPSKEEERKNPYQGPEISTTTYFFKLHTVNDLIVSSTMGIIKTFKDLYFKKNLIGLILFILGSVLMLRNKHLVYIPILVFLLEIPHFFLVAKGLVEYRSMTQSFPLIGLTIGFSIDIILKKIKRVYGIN